MIKAELVEGAVAACVLGYLGDPRIQARIMDYARGLLEDRSGDRDKAIRAARGRVQGIEEQIKNIRHHLRQATDLAEVFYDDLRDLVRQKKDAEGYLRRLQVGHNPEDRRRHLDAVEAMITGVEALWEAATPEERKTILRGFVRRVDLAKGRGAATVEIRVPVLFGELAEVVEVVVPTRTTGSKLPYQGP